MENPTPLETPETAQRSRRFLLPASGLLVILIVVAAGTYAWHSLYLPCEVNEVQETSFTLVSQMSQYDAVYRAAANPYGYE